MSNHFLLALSVFVYLIFTFSLLFKMFKKRTAAVRSEKVDYRYYKTYSQEYGEPKELSVLANHIENQFQLPPIFMTTVVLILSFQTVSLLMVLTAWTFVVLRFLHTYIHLGSNNLLNRAKAYMLGWVVVFALWIQILVHFV